MALRDVADRITAELSDVRSKREDLQAQIAELDRQEASLTGALEAVTGRSANGSRRARTAKKTTAKKTTAATRKKATAKKATAATRKKSGAKTKKKSSGPKVSSSDVVAHVKAAGKPVAVADLKGAFPLQGKSLGGVLGGLVRHGQLQRNEDGTYQTA